MATLTQASIFSKKAFKWIILTIILSVFLIVFLAFGKSVRDSIFAPAAPPATVAFGKIRQLDLSIGISPPASAEYSVETLTGDLPQLPAYAKVYAVEANKFSFGDLDRAKRRAQNIGFTNEPEQISPGLVNFIDPKDDQRVLTIETSTDNFTLKSNFKNDPNVITTKIASLDDVQNRARDFLVNLGVNGDEFPLDNTEVQKLRIDGGSLTDALILHQTNLAKVIFKRAPLDKIPIISPNDKTPPVYVMVSSREIVEANVDIAKVQRFKFATYPLKGVQKAFQELKAKKAAFNKNVQSNQLAIRDVTLGYLESKMNGPYIQPVYLFKGNDFIAYVPAVDDGWIIKTATGSTGN
ncbi:hypothetical protein HYU92_06935 [Candidatus Curtissbacteria bacterium]|nr:hypothetical protein [Candidatus Curtissbacteria bacterium]